MISVFNCDNAMFTSFELLEYAQCVIIPPRVLKDSSIVVIWFNFFQNELMVKIYSKSLPRAIGKVLRMKFS